MTSRIDRFVRLRSPLLRPMADWKDSETPGILRRRRAVIAGMAVLSAAIVLLIRAGLLPAMDVLYVLHDYAALPFWGYTWTRFAPYSITWWSLAGIALIVWLATFLTRRSAVRGLHARLCRVVVHALTQPDRSPRYVARLTAWVDWLGARTLHARLLEDVVRLEQAGALIAIVESSSPLDERAAWRLVRLTDLLTRLTSHAGAPDRQRWRALAVWHQTSMWIDRRTAEAGAKPALLSALATTGRFLLDRLEDVEDAEGDALSSGLRRDLLWLASAFALRASAGLAFAQGERTFVGSVLERLDQLWALAEHGSHDEGAPVLIAKASDEVIEVQGILVSSIGLHAASRLEDVHLAAAYLQAFEALAFVRYLGAAGREGGRVARALTAEAPERDHYRLAADIAERHRSSASAFALRASADKSALRASADKSALRASADRSALRASADRSALRATADKSGLRATAGSVFDEAAGHERTRIEGLRDASTSALRASVDKSVEKSPDKPEQRDARGLLARLQYRIRHRPLPLRMRVDPVLIGGVAAASVVYCAAIAALVLLIFGSSDTARWSARALPDPRLLENVRRSLDTAPFLDAVFHAPDGQMVVSQQGGVLHTYDPDTGLWSTARPFGPNDLARPDIRLLASSTDGRSGALWGVTAGGGLVRRLNGRWEVVVGDTAFVGRRGTPVQQADLSAVAASSDGKWLLAAAGVEGVGVQDLQRRRWLSREEMPRDAGPPAVTHAVWWRDRFYVGGPDGVSELSVAGRPLAFRPVKGLEGPVIALEATASDGLFVHATMPCDNGGRACARVSRMTEPFAPPAVLIDERNRYTELGLDRMLYATQWKDHLLLAGGTGIFDYDARLRSWKRQAAETISAVGACASSSCFYYGYGGRSSGVALFTQRTLAGDAPWRWNLAGEQPTRIAADVPGRAAVLTAAGRAYALAPGAVSTLINPATSSPVPIDRYRDAVTFGDKVLFFGQPGALLHDTVRRSYSPMPGVPPWLRSPSSIVASSGAFLFGLEARGVPGLKTRPATEAVRGVPGLKPASAPSYDVHVATQQQVELGTLFFNTSKPFPIDGPIRAVDASTPDVLRVIDGKGRVQSIAASGVTPLTGGRSSAMANTRLLDVAATGDVLAASTAGGVRLYSMRARTWSDPLPTPDGERAVEIAERNGAWLARSDASRLVAAGNRPAVLIGGGAEMPRRQPDDVLQAGPEIYLSWPGTIQRYDPRARRVAAAWTFDGRESARFAGVIGAEPLSVAGGVARAGQREIARGVHRMFTSGSNAWLVREERGRRHLETHPLASLAAPSPTNTPASACLFRTSGAGVDPNGLRDARRLSNGLVAVATDAGLQVHSRDRHSWYRVAGLLPASGRGSLATIGSTLMVWDASAAVPAKRDVSAGAVAEADSREPRGTLQIVRSAVTLPDSCSTAPARVDRAPDVLAARAVAIDEQGRRAYVLTHDGGVERVEEASTAPMLAAESQGPPESGIVHAWHFPDGAASVLWVATRRSLWQYDLDRHSWLEIAFAYPAPARTSGDVTIDLESRSGEIAVFVTAAAEVFRGTIANEPGRRSKVALARSSGPGPSLVTPAQSPVFRIGAVTFFRNVSDGKLAILQREDGGSVAAYQNRAFAWDRGRRGIAIGPQGPLLLTDAGVHAAGSPPGVSTFDPGPPGVSSSSDRLTSGSDHVPRMLRGKRWYRRAAAGVWEPAPAPSTDAVLADDEGFVWSRRNGSLVVEAGGVHVPIVTGTNGAELATDRLVDAASFGTGIAVLTQGFAEIGGTRVPIAQADALESAAIDGREQLWLTRSGSAFVWSAGRRAFEPAPANADPIARRTLAESGPLRLMRTGSAIEGALRVADLQGRLSWMPIDLSAGRFPFDVVRSIASVGNLLYVGTDAGLQVYDGTDLALDRARLIALGDAPAVPPAIDRVGEPCDTPGIAVFCGPRGCARQERSTFAGVPAGALSCRMRVRSPFWSWRADASGLSGRYAVSANEGPVLSVVDGQLPHDDIGQVVSFGPNIFTVWQERYVSVHATGLALTGARTQAFALPVRLVRVTGPVPTAATGGAERDLPPGLYAIESTLRTWRYQTQNQNQGWTIVSDATELAAIADYAANPPLLQRKRLRLVHRAPAAAPAFEMRMTPGTWRPLAWDASANRYALDVWQDVAVHRQTLWTATPAGLVSREGNWSFDPDTFRVVEGPPQEAGRTATDLRVDASVAELRYDGARAYRVAIDGAAAGPAVRLERDPFAEQTFDTDARYWQWRITGRTGSSAGRLSGTWKGEPIAIVNGRFDFDAIDSAAVFQGLLHVATSTRGWFTLPVDSASLDRQARPGQASPPPLDVARLHGNHDPDEPELCLQGADGQFTRLSPGGATRRTQGCPVLAARTGFWRYTRDGSTLRILPAAGAARPGERRLVDGRFTDDVITGAPVSGANGRRTFTLVPTAAAVMWWDSEGRLVDMHAPPFQGKPDVPRLLQWTAGGPPAYVADGTLYSLERDDRPSGSWTVRLPPKAVFERLGSGPGPLLSIDWSEDGRRHHSVVDPRNGSVSHDDIPIDARRIPAYFRRAMTEQSQDGLIRLRLRDRVVSAYATSEGWPIVETDESFQLLAGVTRGTRAILVGPHHLIELNMERIARAVYSGGSPPPAPGNKK